MRESLQTTLFQQKDKIGYCVVDQEKDPVGWLRAYMGDVRLMQSFGFNEVEYSAAVARNVSESIEYYADIDKRIRDSFWRIHSFERDLDRLGDVSRIGQELPMALNNIRTLIEEYLWANNSVFEMKAVRFGGDMKLVAFDRATMEAERAKDALERESVDVMVKRFEEMKANEDMRYARDEDGLRSRDRAEYALMQDLKACAERVLQGEDLPALVSMSPGPDKSDYANGMGYSTDVRFSHLRVYRFDKVSDCDVVIRASTIFHYAPLWRQRIFAFCNADRYLGRRIPLIGFGHLDFLKSPYFIGSMDDQEIDEMLNGKQSFDWVLSSEVREKIEAHRARRLDRYDREYRDRRMNYLMKRYVWQYVLLTVRRAPLVARMQVLIDLLEDEKVSFREYVLEKEQRLVGRRYSAQERVVRGWALESFLEERGNGGLCPVLNMSSKQDGDGKGGGVSSEKEVCILKCGGFKQDKVTGILYKCVWQAKAERGKIYDCCPECGWKPGVIQHFDVVVRKGVLVEQVDFARDGRRNRQVVDYQDIVEDNKVRGELEGEYEQVSPLRMEAYEQEDAVAFFVGLIVLKRRVS